MSDSDRDDDPVTVSADGVTVRKSYEKDEFPVPAIAFRIESERAEPTEVRLVDHIPEGFGMDDIGFHPEYGSEHWSAEGDRVTFERQLDPDEEYVTVYGIRVDDAEAIQQFLTEPEIELVELEGTAEPEASDVESGIDGPDEDSDLVGEAEGIVSEESSQVVRDVISGEAETVPGLDEDVAAEPPVNGDDEPAPATADDASEAGEPAESDIEPDEGVAGGDDAGDEAIREEDRPEPDKGVAATPAGETSEEHEPDQGETPASVVASGHVATALADELREGSVSEEDLDRLRDALGETSASTDARITYLQSEVADLAAYKDALEAFIDENGVGHELLDELRDEVAGVDDRLGRIEERTEENAEDIASVHDAVDELDEDIDELEDDFDDLREDVDGRVEDVRDDLDDRIAGLEDELEADLGERVAALEEELDDRIDDLESEVRTLQDDIDELSEWRERLGAVADILGGSAEAGGGGEDGENGEDDDA